MTSNEPNNHQEIAVSGLVLAGGKSIRMGTDKGRILWHGQEQRYYVADLLRAQLPHVFISCRPEQQTEIDPSYTVIPDSVTGAGPLIAILSAFAAYPDRAWLVVACDLPLLDKATIQYLLHNRDETKIATTFQSPFDGLPEPLITIWEPSSLPVLRLFFAENFNCPRKALIRNLENVKVLLPPNPDALLNANTPDDTEKVRAIIEADPVGD